MFLLFFFAGLKSSQPSGKKAAPFRLVFTSIALL
jgi:hypothetical protein